MRTPRTLLAAGLAATFFLAACGDDDGGSSADTTTAEAAATTAAPAAAGALPTVAGEAGTKPTITIPAADPPADLVVEVLSEGDGDPVAAGDFISAHYVGQLWRDGSQFDASWDRGEPAQFPVGTGNLIPAWDQGLVGVPYGSRVLIVAPPEFGYGSGGNPAAGISGDDTLVFVVDLVERVS